MFFLTCVRSCHVVVTNRTFIYVCDWSSSGREAQLFSYWCHRSCCRHHNRKLHFFSKKLQKLNLRLKRWQLLHLVPNNLQHCFFYFDILLQDRIVFFEFFKKKNYYIQTESNKTAIPRNTSYSDELAAFEMEALQPAANGGAKMTKDQILAGFGQGL